MPNEPGEDWLDARLREENPYIDDAGFTAQVLQKLPAHRAQRSFRGLILLCLTLLACGLTYAVSGGGAFLVSAVNQFAQWPLWLVCATACLSTVLISAVAAGAAFVKAREEVSG